MLIEGSTIEERFGLSAGSLPEDVLSSTEPLVLRGLVNGWPAVEAMKVSSEAGQAYLLDFYQGATVGLVIGPPEIEGRVFYNDDLTGFNFQSVRTGLGEVMERINRHRHDPGPPVFYVGSTSVDTCLPGFRGENDLALDTFEPLVSLWLGNRTRVAAHFDMPDNIACCVAGRRRFTLFPPEQLENLYVGPLDFTPAGQAISLVDFHRPDFDRFPRFHKALEAARQAVLEPGDALFVPSMWWHHVEALDAFNLLINYWWRRSPAYLGRPMSALEHALFSIRDLPAEQRRAWQELFRYYVFEYDEAASGHIPEGSRGMLDTIDETAARRLRAQLQNQLKR